MRRYVTVLLIALVITLSFSAFPIQPAQAVPTSTQLKTAIDAGESYIDHLYEIDGWYDYVKEYPAIPLTTYTIDNGQWTPLGQDRIWVDPATGEEYPMTKIEVISIGSTSEKFRVMWEDVYGGDYDYNEPVLEVTRYYYTGGKTRYDVKFVKYDGAFHCDIYLGDTKIFSNVGSETPPQTVTKYKYNYESYPAHRYTPRHGLQLCQLIYETWGDKWYGKYLTNLLKDYGFTYDIYDPLFFESVNEPTGFMFSDQAYHDVDVYSDLPRGMNPHRYPYRSKVMIDRTTYIAESHLDPLLRGLWAIHLLNKFDDPDKEEFYMMVGTTPLYTTARKSARWIESNWWNGYGIYYPTNYEYASGVRSAVFLTLETLLGYKYGDTTSKSYADTMASVMVQVQWGLDGYGETADYGVVLRPPHAGGFLLSWKTGTSYPYAEAPKSWLEQIIDMFAMPREDDGIIPTNLESTVTAIQALRVYLYYKDGEAYPNKRRLAGFFWDDFDDGDFDQFKTWFNWDTDWGTWVIEDGMLTSTDDNGRIRNQFLKNWKDYEFTVDTITAGWFPPSNYTVDTWDVGWQYFRFADKYNHYYMLIHLDGKLELTRRKNDVKTILYKEDHGLDPTVWHTVKIRVEGGETNTRIRIWIDGSLYLDYTDTNAVTVGSVGFYTYEAYVHWDNVLVKSV